MTTKKLTVTVEYTSRKEYCIEVSKDFDCRDVSAVESYAWSQEPEEAQKLRNLADHTRVIKVSIAGLYRTPDEIYFEGDNGEEEDDD